MRALNKDLCERIIERIISDFGDGTTQAGRYVFDRIVRLPPGFVEERVPSSKLLAELTHQREVFVIFDPHPNNCGFIIDLLRRLGCENAEHGLAIGGNEAETVISATDCDFYLTTPQGSLLAVGCHEDEVRGQERLMWRPVQIKPVL